MSLSKVVGEASGSDDVLNHRQPFEKQVGWNFRFSRIIARAEARKELLSPRVTLSRCIEVMTFYKGNYKSMRLHSGEYGVFLDDGNKAKIPLAILSLYLHEIREDLKIMKLAISKGIEIMKALKDFSLDDVRFLRIITRPDIAPRLSSECRKAHIELVEKCAKQQVSSVFSH